MGGRQGGEEGWNKRKGGRREAEKRGCTVGSQGNEKNGRKERNKKERVEEWNRKGMEGKTGMGERERLERSRSMEMD